MIPSEGWKSESKRNARANRSVMMVVSVRCLGCAVMMVEMSVASSRSSPMMPELMRLSMYCWCACEGSR